MADVGSMHQLDFHRAMEDFKKMFPDMDIDVIEAVLRTNHGAVHATIDQLLLMSVETESGHDCTDGRSVAAQSVPEMPPSYSLSATPPPSYQQVVPMSKKHIDISQSEEPPDKNIPLCLVNKWNPPMLLPLPNDFLRLSHFPARVDVLSPSALSKRISENAMAREAVGESDAELAQYLADERIALFLQNNEFMNELCSNEEFVSALQKDLEEEGEDLHHLPHAGNRGLPVPLDEATLRVRIANMGKASRKKFAQLARVFSRGKRGAMSRPLEASSHARDQLISTDPLIDEDDDERLPQDERSSETSSPKHL